MVGGGGVGDECSLAAPCFQLISPLQQQKDEVVVVVVEIGDKHLLVAPAWSIIAILACFLLLFIRDIALYTLYYVVFISSGCSNSGVGIVAVGPQPKSLL